MSKRGYSSAFEQAETSKVKISEKYVKKHSLDSDEEDSGEEEEKQNVLQADDIEGEEDGDGGIRDEITITPFNMKEELEEGHFDNAGHYHWKKEKEIRDGWLDNIDWVKVKGRPEDKYKVDKDPDMKGLGDESSSEDEQEEKVDVLQNYKELITHMKPKETIAKTLQRLGASSKISSAERWRRKKAGIVDENAKVVTRVTELANQILTAEGNMDVYQESYEKIKSIIAKKENKGEDIELDMYADDFDQKEKQTLGSSDANGAEKGPENTEDEESKPKLMWEYRTTQSEDSEILGPYTTEQMDDFSKNGKFKSGVWARKVGEIGQFYTSNRIDFELYL